MPSLSPSQQVYLHLTLLRLISRRDEVIDIPISSELLDAVLPDTTHEHRVKSFNDILAIHGSIDAAKTFYEQHYEFMKDGAVIGALLPFDLSSPLPEEQPFSWNLYLGWANQDQESIMTDWEKKGILVEVSNLVTSRRQRFGALTILPSTTYSAKGGHGVWKEEVILPGDPKDAHIPICNEDRFILIAPRAFIYIFLPPASRHWIHCRDRESRCIFPIFPGLLLYYLAFEGHGRREQRLLIPLSFPPSLFELRLIRLGWRPQFNTVPA
ncbi:hypothetical protein B0H11DRAFT_2257906 [Mycena galericulata]|nr:hypothetical protein B0H11DRAFT_2257906 [Mycena galericulata]